MDAAALWSKVERANPTALSVAALLVHSTAVGLSAQASTRQLRGVEELRIGGIDGPAVLTFVHGLVVADSLVFVAQGQEDVIRVFTWNGERRPSIGGSGEGPGEFRRVDYVGWIDGQLVAMDEGLLRVSRFSADGRLFGTDRVPVLPSVPPLYWSGRMYPVVGDRVVVSATASYRQSERVRMYPVVLAGLNGEIVDTLPGLHSRGWQRVLEGVVFMAPIHWGTRWSVSPNGRYYAVADGNQAEVALELYDVAKLETTPAGLPLPARAVPEHHAMALAGRYQESMGRTVLGRMSPERFADELDLPESAVGVDFMQVMNDGSIWLSEPNFGASERIWHVVDPVGGRELAIVRAPGDIVILQSDGRHAWGRAMDEYLVHYVVRLRLEPLHRR